MGLVFIDGKYYSEDQAKVSVFDHGFLFGDGLFETMRAYQGLCFRISEHLARLFKGAKALGISVPYQPSELSQLIQDTIDKNQLQEAYVRITLTRGIGRPGIDPATCPKPSVFIVALPLTPYPQSAYQEGWHAVILETVRNSTKALPPEIKSMNFLNNILGKIEVANRGVSEGFFLNQEGYLTEGLVSNMFIVVDGQVLTPSIECGLLPGITRKAVLELCTRLEIRAHEKKLLPEDLFRAEECFITNSLAEIIPICWVDGKALGTGRPGPVTRLLLKQYKMLVNEEICKK